VVGVFWLPPPRAADRRTAAARTGADLHRLFPYEPDYGTWSDDLFAGRAASNEPKTGILVEIQHLQTDYVDRVLDSVLVEADPDEEKHNLIGGILDGIALHPSPKLDEWGRRAAIYPDDLAEAVVRRHAQIDHFWRAEMWLARGGNRMMLYDMLIQVERQLLHMLLGINHVFYFGFKWLDVLDARLRLKPRDLVTRLRDVHRVPADEAAQRLSSLVEGTYDLVEAEFPEIDIDRLRAIFRYRRPVWDEAPEWPMN
jgi:hypothetical protein